MARAVGPQALKDGLATVDNKRGGLPRGARSSAQNHVRVIPFPALIRLIKLLDSAYPSLSTINRILSNCPPVSWLFSRRERSAICVQSSGSRTSARLKLHKERVGGFFLRRCRKTSVSNPCTRAWIRPEDRPKYFLPRVRSRRGDRARFAT